MTGLANDLMTRGFSVIPAFLDAAAIAGFADDFDGGSQLDNQMYTLGVASPERIDALKPAITRLLETLRRDSEIDVNFIGGGAFFATRNGINFGWHQDHESYFMGQTHRNYLNLYIPVIKPDPARSNLSVIPIDHFRAREPALWSKLEWGGATSAVYREDKTHISDDCRGGLHGSLDFNIQEMAETPQLAAGDALLLRGDMFHRTQDAETHRVALSIRMLNDTHEVTRAHFNQTCQTKNAFMARNRNIYDRIRNVFETHESLTYRQLMNLAWRRA
jgi:hypothetical protein